MRLLMIILQVLALFYGIYVVKSRKKEEKKHQFSLKGVSDMIMTLAECEDWNKLKANLSFLMKQRWFTLQQKDLLIRICDRILTLSIPQNEKEPAIELLNKFYPQLKDKSFSVKKEAIAEMKLRQEFPLTDYMIYFGISFESFKVEYKDAVIRFKTSNDNTNNTNKISNLNQNLNRSSELFQYVLDNAGVVPLFTSSNRSKKSSERGLFEYQFGEVQQFFSDSKPRKPSEISAFFQYSVPQRELDRLILQLMRLKKLRGYYDGTFYSNSYLADSICRELDTHNKIDLVAYANFPRPLITGIIHKIEEVYNDTFIYTSNGSKVYLASHLISELEKKANKNPLVDFGRLQSTFDKPSCDFLIERCIKENIILPQYPGNDRTKFLTHTGKGTIRGFLTRYRAVGYIDLSKIGKKCGVDRAFVESVLEDTIDLRSGIYNREKTIFYFNTTIFGGEEMELPSEFKNSRVKLLEQARENQKALLNELSSAQSIFLPDYLFKLGMTRDQLIENLNELNKPYVIQNNRLLLGGETFEKYLNSVTENILHMARTKHDFKITGGQLEIPEPVAYKLVKDLTRGHDIQGFIYKKDGHHRFITRTGLAHLFMKYPYTFSLSELFPSHTFRKAERRLINGLIKELLQRGSLSGNYDRQKLQFISDNAKNAKSYSNKLSSAKREAQKCFKKFEYLLGKLAKLMHNESSKISGSEQQEIEKLIGLALKNEDRWWSDLFGFLDENLGVVKRESYKSKSAREQGAETNLPLLGKDNKGEPIYRLDEIRKDIRIKRLEDRYYVYRALVRKLAVKYQYILRLQLEYINEPSNTRVKRKYLSALEKFHLKTDTNKEKNTTKRGVKSE